jgi:hypothetical protein
MGSACYQWAVLLKDPRVKRALYRSGALAAWHRRRNRDRLTVIMFHRVVAPSDPRWPTSDPEYTLPDHLFVECLRFFRRHYNVIGLETTRSTRCATCASTACRRSCSSPPTRSIARSRSGRSS